MAISHKGMRTLTVAQKTYFWRTHMDSDFLGVHAVIVTEEAFVRGHRGQQLKFFVPRMIPGLPAPSPWPAVPSQYPITPAIIRRAIELASAAPSPFTGALDAGDVVLDAKDAARLFESQ
jgi:hypothetical protein